MGQNQDQDIIATTRRWIERFVVGLNLCPFAQRELEHDRVRFAVTRAESEAELLRSLQDEFALLVDDEQIETTLLIHPHALPDFFSFNQFLGDCECLLRDLDLEGVFQIASFHPQYQFAGTEPTDAENYSNRSPYPMLHILRESSVERAVAAFPGDIHEVPARNIALLNEQGMAQLQILWQACIHE